MERNVMEQLSEYELLMIFLEMYAQKININNGVITKIKLLYHPKEGSTENLRVIIKGINEKIDEMMTLLKIILRGLIDESGADIILQDISYTMDELSLELAS